MGSVTINHTVFGYLSTASLDFSNHGGIAILNSRVAAAAPAPLWRVRGGNGTRFENVTFAQPASPSLVVLERPTGEEEVSGLRFGCGREGEVKKGWTAAAIAGGSTVSDGLRSYLLKAEEVAECDFTDVNLNPQNSGETKPQNAVDTESQKSANYYPRTAASSHLPSKPHSDHRGSGLFSDPSQVGLELAILALAAAVVTVAVAAIVVVMRRRKRREVVDTQVLVETSDASEE